MFKGHFEHVTSRLFDSQYYNHNSPHARLNMADNQTTDVLTCMNLLILEDTHDTIIHDNA